MPRLRSPAVATIKIPADLRKKVAEVARDRGCFQHRLVSEALTEYFRKLDGTNQQTS